MGYLSSGLGSLLKIGGGAAGLYGGYKLAREDRDEIKGSVSGALEGDPVNGWERALNALESTGEEVEGKPEYGSHLGTLSKGLAVYMAGRHLKGQNQQLYDQVLDQYRVDDIPDDDLEE